MLFLLERIEIDLEMKRKPKLDEFKRILRAHERLEDEIFYPKLDEELNEDEKQLFIDRHEEIVLG